MRDLKTDKNPYLLLTDWGLRLRKAMGEEEILSRYHYIGGEFRVPTYRSMAEALDRSPWTASGHGEYGGTLFVVPYNQLYDGWEEIKHRSGFMCVCVNPYEYSYSLWDRMTSKYSPDLLDNGTFGIWSELLPEPCSFVYENGRGILKWNSEEPRVYRAKEMGRYQLRQAECKIEVVVPSWRIARAEAYVQAWEKMAAMEPTDRYKSVMLEEHERLEAEWKRA